MKKTYRWKFLREVDGKFKSNSGDCVWEIGEQKKFYGELSLCASGYHCSKGVYQAFSYVQGEILAKVEVSGKNIAEDDKEVWEKMKIAKAYKWTKKDSVELAIYSAKQVIKLYEKEYPNDDRPRNAIEAAVKYIKNPTEENRQAAGVVAEAAWAAPIKRIAIWMDKRVKSLEVIN